MQGCIQEENRTRQDQHQNTQGTSQETSLQDNITAHGNLIDTTCVPQCPSNNGNHGFMAVGNYALLQPQLLHRDDVAQQSQSRTDTDDKHNDYVDKARIL